MLRDKWFSARRFALSLPAFAMNVPHNKLRIFAAVFIGGIIALVVATQLACHILKAQVMEALGPESQLDSIHLGLTGVVVEGLRIRAPKDWPTQDSLRAKRVIIRPDLRALLTGTYRVGSITVEEAYLSVLRTSSGRIRMLPNLLEKPRAKSSDPERPSSDDIPQVSFGHIELRDSALEFFDATIRRPPFKLRLEQLQMKVSDLRVPQLNTRSDITLEGVIKGVQHDGNITVKGWMEPASQDSSIRTTLHEVDLVALEPYLIKASETGVQRGSLDLDVQSEVRRKQLQAPGTVSLSGLRLTSGSGSFMGVPRAMVLSFLKNGKDQIILKFKLDGDLNNPHFSLNEAMSTRIASGMAETLGLSLGGLAQGVGTMGQKGAQAVGDTAKDMGNAIGHLFSGEEKK
jgi:hypothetical protein